MMTPLRSLMLLWVAVLGFAPLFGRGSRLSELDRIVEGRHAYEAVKRAEIDGAKAEYATATTDSDRYNTLRNLYQAYRNFRIDSALIVADERLAIARRTGVPARIASATINLAESYVKSGFPDEALHLLDTLRGDNLEDYHRKYRGSVLRGAYMLKSLTSPVPGEREEARRQVEALREAALRDSRKDSKGYYTLQAEKLMDAGLYDRAVEKMEQADSLFDFSGDAAQQYTMGEIYLAAGRRREAIDCLARSASIDLSSGVKEYRSLILLASLLFEEGDMERAFRYINAAFDDAHFSGANLRTPEIMDSLQVINQAFHAYEREDARRTRLFLWCAVAMAALLVAVSVVLWRTLASNRKMLATIADINSRLERRNRELLEADALKLQNINTLMLTNARYISRLKDFRKSVYRLMKTGQYDKALDALRSDRTDARDVAAFHEMFDRSFLSMFPDFLKSVSSILKEPVELREEGRLTPELRVMALMRLGLSSTEEIAGMLHYSAQTVYNLRTSIRNMTTLSREEFEAKIKEI